MGSFSQRLMQQIRERKVPLLFDTKAELLRNLALLYDCCVASEYLLLSAKAESRRRNDTVLSDYYAKHYLEEKDEAAILKEDLGGAINDPPNPIVMAMIGTQYYLLRHVHPVCLLGYMAIVEADPMPIEAVEKLENQYGKDLLRFVRLHAIKDVGHASEILELIDALPEKQQELITLSAKNSLMYLYG